MKIENYLSLLNEQIYGFPPAKPVKNPTGYRSTTHTKLQPRPPKVPKLPENPYIQKKKELPKQTKDEKKNEKARKTLKSYFNYMKWTSKILKQGETFRKKAYKDNCWKFEAGTGERRICKDRCDIETCKKVIQLLRISMAKCSESEFPDQCKVRYMQLIPLYQNKLNQISQKFIKDEKNKKANTANVG